MPGKRRLDENAMDCRISVEGREELEQFSFSDIFRQGMSGRANLEAGAGAFLHPDIDLGGGVLADADKSQTGLEAFGLQQSNTISQLAGNLCGDRPTVNQLARRHQGITWSVSTSMTGVRHRTSRYSSPVTATR